MVAWDKALTEMKQALQEAQNAGGVQLVISPQLTSEEAAVALGALKSTLGPSPKVFVWHSPDHAPLQFDGILMRGDKHANTNGISQVLAQSGIEAQVLADTFGALESAALTIVLGPEIAKSYSNFDVALEAFGKLKKVVYVGTTLSPKAQGYWMRLPAKVFAEKSGTFVNHKGIAQKLKANPPVMPLVRGVDEIFQSFAAGV